MTTHYRRPSEVFASQRRTSTTAAAGFDHSSCYRVEEDILSRVRSLRLSRNLLYPPRTPYTSDEDRHRYSADCDKTDTADRLDFGVAKSIPGLIYRRTKSEISNMDISRRLTQPSVPVKRRTLRTTSSTNDLGASLHDDTVHATLTCCPPSSPEEPKKPFRLPHLVLKDKREKKKRDIEFRSCIDFTPRIPGNDGSIGNADPRGDVPGKVRGRSVERVVALNGKVKAEPADITCFLAGCGPGECNRHSRRSSQQAFSPKQKLRSRAGTDSVGKDMAEVAYELGLMANDREFRSAPGPPRVAGQPQLNEILKQQPREKQSRAGEVHAPKSRQTNIRAGIQASALSDPMPTIDHPRLSSSIRPKATQKERQGLETAGLSLRTASQLSSSRRADDVEKDSRLPGLTSDSPSVKSLTSSVLSQDAFPHVVKSQEIAAKATLAQSFSGTIVTNFSLPGPKTKKAQPVESLYRKDADVSLPPVAELAVLKQPNASLVRSIDSVRPKQSETSLQSKPYSPSLLSGASKSSSVRHALLKPSVSATEPMDTGLPIPPILTQIAASFETTVMDAHGPVEAGSAQGALGVLESTMAEGASSQILEKPMAINAGRKSFMNDSGSENTQKSTGIKADEISTAAVVSPLTALQQAQGLADRVEERIIETEESTSNEIRPDKCNATFIQNPAVISGILQCPAESSSKTIGSLDNLITPISNSTVSAEASSKSISKPIDGAELSTQPLSKSIASLRNVLGSEKRQGAPPENISAVDHVNATYWGFVPSVKEAVQDAVQVAVRKAVYDIAIPPGSEHDQASHAYRKLVGDSLAEAAQTADEYLRRASLWNEPPCSERSFEGSADFQDCKIRDHEPLIVGASPKDTHPEVASNKQTIRSADQNQRESSTRNLNENRGNIMSNAATSQVSSKTSSLESRQNLMRRMENAGRDNIETIPLQNMDEVLAENHEQSWKSSDTWNGPEKEGSPGHTAIPTRHSSKNHVLGSKNRTTTNPSGKESWKGSRFKKVPLEPLRPKTSRVLRTVSSHGSLHSRASNVREQPSGQDSTVKEVLEANDGRCSVAKISSVEKLGRRNTVHWLRDLLSTNGPYETRFTALPPRPRRRDQNSSTGRFWSQNVSAKPVTELFLDATPESDLVKSGIPKIEHGGRQTGEENLSSSKPEAGDFTTAAITQTFTKTINDLEFLLNEALFIARQAADREDGYAAGLLGSAAAVLTGGRKGVEDETVRRRVEDGRGWSLRYSQKRSDNVSSFASVHESLGSYSGSGSSESSEGVQEPEYDEPSPPKLRLITPTIGIADAPELTQTIQRVGWLPSGRVPTPYPPGSVAPHYEVTDDENTSDSFQSTKLAGTNLKLLKKETEARGPTVLTSLDQREVLGENQDPPIPELASSLVQDVNPFLGERVRTEPESARSSEAISPTKRSRAATRQRSQTTASCFVDDNTLILNDPKPLSRLPTIAPITPRGASITKTGKQPFVETDPLLAKVKLSTDDSMPSRRKVREYIKAFHHPPIQPRASSLNLRKQAEKEQEHSKGALPSPTIDTHSWQNKDSHGNETGSQADLPHPLSGENLVKPGTDHEWALSYTQSYDGSHPSDAVHFDAGFAHRQHVVEGGEQGGGHDAIELRDSPDASLPQVSRRGGNGKPSHNLFNLEGRNHVSLRGVHHKGFSFARTHKKPKIARDWAPARKRFVATVACISTALVGLLVGIYAAEVPAIQYWIVDLHHYTILGNVFFFIGLSIPTFFFWPLPLLHGRKPYTLGSMALAMPLLFPQALAVGQFRSPYIDYWRVGLILPRALMGFVLGFANMNFKGTLTDLFGASLQNENPHQEVVDEDDVRRHGGGLGVWLGIWTWCSIGSIGMGFLFGAIIINHAQPAWGFYVSIAIIAGVLFLNVLCPEVRRSAFRRSVAEVKNGTEVSRRVARGEVKMHMVQTGPLWWGEEFHYGVLLNAKMLRQPGFMVMAFYVAWIYGQIVLLIVLLGSLTSKYYKFKSPYVGASVMAVPIGAFLAIPFQKASLFSRSRANAELEDDNANTLNKKITLSSHLVRRAIFILVLPFAGLGYTLTSNGPPIPFILPILFAGLIGFLSNLAMGECHGIIMETFDTSDLQPGMTGRPRGSSGDRTANKRTNYSSFPRVSSGFAITQGIGYLFAAIATGVGGVAERNIGQQAATGVMAGILLILSLLLLGVLARFRNVQIIPASKEADMERWKNARRVSAIRQEEGLGQPEEWRPVIIGNPTHIMRRMCILEMGGMTRWSEIRRKNHLVDQNALESKHPNLAVIRDLEDRIKETEEEILHHVRRSISRHSLSRNSSRRSRRSDRDEGQPGDLGGHREMLNRPGKGSRRRQRTQSRIPE